MGRKIQFMVRRIEVVITGNNIKDMGFLRPLAEIYRDIYACKVGQRLLAVNLQSQSW